MTTYTTGSRINRIYSDALGRSIRSETEGFIASEAVGEAPNIFVDTEYNTLGQISRKSRAYFSGDSIYWHEFTYDVLGRNVSDYHYDAFGNLIMLEDALHNVTQNTYDIRGRKISMNDPDMGEWHYSYNALGELINQSSAKDILAGTVPTVSMRYDDLGRLISRTELEGVSEWEYDTATNGIGKLARVSGAEGKDEQYQYDELGRLSSTITTIDDTDYIMSQSYDAYSRVDTLTYPASPNHVFGFEVNNHYNGQDYLERVSDSADIEVYWQAKAMDASGQLTTTTE